MSQKFLLYLCICIFLYLPSRSQTPATGQDVYSHADTLRGSMGPERVWWDLLKYELSVEPDYAGKTLKGTNTITFAVLRDGQTMQIDLQEPMRLIAATWKNKALTFTREGNVFHLRFPKTFSKGSVETVVLSYEGAPKIAVAAPWDGGWVWTQDEKGRPWISAAVEGVGLSTWLPCKEQWADEPDSGVVMHIVCADSLVAIGNGRLRDKQSNGKGKMTYTWVVTSPINGYDIVPYIGKYVNWSKVFDGAKGKLDCNFWVLDYNLGKAKPQFQQVDTMLRAFEYWMGPFPFYEDGYKLVESPYLGMEHQSNIAYGNHFQEGYQGFDVSQSGWGLNWDEILVHESSHEWFGNSVTAKDPADMWIQEGITVYSEVFYMTLLHGVEAGNDYCIGLRKLIANDKPAVGAYGVNNEGSADCYTKSANMLHMIRQMIGDSAFRGMVRGMQRTFYHKTVTTQAIEHYISAYAHRDLSTVFEQYLRTTKIPVLVYQSNGNVISYRWENCVKGFDMPVRVYVGELPPRWIYPTENWQTMEAGTDGQVLTTRQLDANAVSPVSTDLHGGVAPPGLGPKILVVGATGNGSGGDGSLSVDRNFYIAVRKKG